jgi:hypothetical protein
MSWLLPILIHLLISLIALVDAVSQAMTPRGRVAWLTAVALAPLLGAAAYFAWGRTGRADDGEQGT